MRCRRAVVIGASIAGVTAAESLREAGYDGDVVLADAEVGNPYQRPPLSKEVLAGAPETVAELTSAASLATQGIELRTGTRATNLDTTNRSVTLDDEVVSFTELVLATGAAPVVPFRQGAELVHVLRTRDHAAALRAALLPGARVVVVGGGVLGSEIATAARDRGCAVALVSARPVLGLGPTGTLLGEELASLHRSAGVALHLGRLATGVVADGDAVRLHLADGGTLPADVVVVAAGAAPQTRWLADALPTSSRGVRCGPTGRAAPSVWAAGDCAHWRPTTGFPGTQTAAIDQGRIVAADIRGLPGPRTLPPYFWADVHGVRVQLVGRVPIAPERRRTHGPDGTCTLLLEDRTVVGVLGRGAPRTFRTARQALGTVVTHERTPAP